MSKEERKVPELRFKGFHDDWEQRSISNIAILNPKSSLPETFKYIDLESVKDNRILSYKEERAHSAPSRAQRVASKGDIFFQTVRPYQKNNFLYNLNDNDYVFSTGYAQIRPFISSHFLLYRLLEDNFVNKVLRSSTGTSYPSINSQDLSKINFAIPIDEMEQEKIGALLNKLNNYIVLHQRKNNILETLKRTFVHHMLPRHLEKTPNIIFKNVNSHWKEDKAKEIFSSITEKNQKELPVLSISQEEGVIHRKDVGKNIQYDPTTLKNYKVVRPGNFIISLRSFQGGFELSNLNGITSPAYTVFALKNQSSNDINFWKTYFKSYKFIESLKTVTFGIRDGRSISYSDFSSLTLSYPSTKHEQYSIGLFFDKVDKVIIINQNKILKLQQLKASYLRKMFL